MVRNSFDVAIIGGGIGGLCLAQGLKRAGIQARVYERDETAFSRRQGFRIHIDPCGSASLHQCLPPDLWEIFDATEGEFSRGFAFLTEQLGELLSLGAGDATPEDSIARHRSISRITLRGLLLSGLGGSVHFGKRLLRYAEAANDRIAMYFEDGSRADCSILVGADGVNSTVRKQYLSHAEPTDTGVVGLGGKAPLTHGVFALLPEQLLNGPVLVIPPQQSSLFMAIWKRSPQSGEILRRLGIDERLADEEDYLTLGLGARSEHLGLGGNPRAASPERLKKILRDNVRHWHPNLRKLVEMTEDAGMMANPIRSSARVSEWRTTNVTLLGDAIHSMTPYRGIGANIALRDAALLCSKLAESVTGEKPVLQAIGEYEAAMRTYAFDAVEASLRAMKHAVCRKQNPGFGLTRTAMRVINKVPALKRRLMPA